MTNKITPGQLLSWTAWVSFLVFLFLPTEYYSMSKLMSGPVTDYGWQWSVWMVFMIIWSVFHLIHSPDFLTLTTMTGWSLIGIGEILLFLAPILSNKIKSSFLRKLHAGIILLSTTAIFLYQFDLPILEMMGGEVRIGYYCFVLSSLFLLAASISKMLHSNE